MPRLSLPATLGLVLSLGLTPGLWSAAAGSGKPGITGIGAEVSRVKAPDAPAGKLWLYQVALPFQVSSTQAAVFCNVREALAQGVDFEVGNDVIVFGSLREFGTATPVAVNRNHVAPNPNSQPAGKPATMVKYPIRGGFIPLGAKRKDGTVHPHAGTGFGLSMVQAWKILVDGPPPYLQGSYRDAESYSYWDVQQFAFDGKSFRVTGIERVMLDQMLPGWVIPNGGLNNAIADGDDMLVAMVGKQPKGEPAATRQTGSGVMRMSRASGSWRPVAFTIVPRSESLFEPSLIRDVDGALLFSGRGGRDPNRQYDVRIWRSTDNGRTWGNHFEVNGIIVPPITLNQAADGTPYIAADQQDTIPGPQDPLTLKAKQAGQPQPVGKNSRSTLAIWPFNAARNGLMAPLIVRDCRASFGPPNGGSSWTWRADHPSGMTVRLADGKWHHVLGVRIQDYREIKEAMPPTPHTGSYLHEVISAGPPHPVWQF